jgi:hypothetical protein
MSILAEMVVTTGLLATGLTADGFGAGAAGAGAGLTASGATGTAGFFFAATGLASERFTTAGLAGERFTAAGLATLATGTVFTASAGATDAAGAGDFEDLDVVFFIAVMVFERS